MFKEFLTRNTRVKVTNTKYTPCEMGEEAYRLAVRADGTAELFFSAPRGRRYAERALGSLTNASGTLVCEAEDAPALAIRGVIEGFYGRPYDMRQRRDLLAFLAEHRMNAYFYAPKDDLYHRDLWREAYPEALLKPLSELISEAKALGIAFYFCLSPGKDFCFSKEEDYALLMKKFEQIRAVGAEDFALLFDDIPPELSEEDGLKFSSAGEAQCYAANFVNRRLDHRDALVFCPTDYFRNTDTPYRRAVKQDLDEDIRVFWTGYNTVAEAIPERDCREAKEDYGHRLILWDNYPVNDYEPKKRVYMDAVCNRTRRIAAYHDGCVVNPSALWECSKIALAAAAEWMWDPARYDEERAYQRAVEEQLGASPEARFFADLNRSSVLRRYPGNEARFAAEDWAFLDGYYARYERTVRELPKQCRRELAAELEPLFRWGEAECALYRAMRAGRPVADLLRAMEALPLRTADQSLLRYLAARGERDITFQERPVYWETERMP